MPTYLNPEIYTENISVFPPNVEEVDSAQPAFVGYTEKAMKLVPNDLILLPVKISSIREYELFFGKPFCQMLEFEVSRVSSSEFILHEYKDPSPQYLLYFCVRLYFENGGTPCYILSVGTYQNPPIITLSKETGDGQYGLLDGLNKLADVADLSLIIIPEAVRLAELDFSTLAKATLKQCSTLGNRFAIFDLPNGEQPTLDLAHNRSLFGDNYLNYGSVYYPFVRTKMKYPVNAAESNVRIKFKGEIQPLWLMKKTNRVLRLFVLNEIKKRSIVIPSCGVVAGVFTFTDKNRGVWKSPSNLNLVGVSEPVIYIDNQQQELLTKDPQHGKSINAIRYFADKGIQIWGSRTLMGKHTEWRYVPVCRFFIMVKESLWKSTSWVILEPNNPKTWQKVIAMIEHYLTLKWKEGALAGVSPLMAFYVKCGLGATMTERDIQDGKVLIEVGLAILRPGEFIVLRFSHQQKRE